MYNIDIGKCCHSFGTFSSFRKHLNTKHAEKIEHDVQTEVFVDGDGVEDNVQSQDLEEAASSSQALPVTNTSTRDMCYCTASGCWSGPIYLE